MRRYAHHRVLVLTHSLANLQFSVLRAIRFSNIGLLTTVAGVLYAVILFLLAVFFFVVGIRVLHRLKAGAVVASSNAKAAQRTLRSVRSWCVTCCMRYVGVLTL